MSSRVEVVVGVLGRAHGLRGEVSVEVRTDEPERRLAVGRQLRTEGGGLLTITSVRHHSGRLLLTFAELADRTAVESARGTRLLVDVPADETPEGAEEFYDRQLVGLRVLNAAGADVGEVTAVLHLPAQDSLEVSTAHGTRLVPLVRDLVPEIDLEQRHVRLADLPGLLDDDAEA